MIRARCVSVEASPILIPESDLLSMILVCISASSIRDLLILLSFAVGRYGKINGQWPLWTADTDNPSIIASTGYPLCLPRVDPAVGDDPLCPKKNRPLDSRGKPLTELCVKRLLFFGFSLTRSSFTVLSRHLQLQQVVLTPISLSLSQSVSCLNVTFSLY